MSGNLAAKERKEHKYLNAFVSFAFFRGNFTTHLLH